MSSIGGARAFGGVFRSCSGGVTTLDDAVVSNRAMHNHPVDTTEIKAHKIRSRQRPRHKKLLSLSKHCTHKKSRRL